MSNIMIAEAKNQIRGFFGGMRRATIPVYFTQEHPFSTGQGQHPLLKEFRALSEQILAS
jgi:hypothetical protein